MATTLKALATISRTGLNPATAMAAPAGPGGDGNVFDNSSGKVFIYVTNGSGTACVVTIEIPGTVDGEAVADKTVSIPDGQSRFIGPFPKSIYNQADADNNLNEAVNVTFSTVTSVTWNVFYMPGV